MTIGEKIIAAIEEQNFQTIEDIWGGVKISFKPGASDALDALVAAHVEEQVRLRLERAVLWLVDEGYKKDVVLAELSKPTTEYPAD